MKSDLEDYYSTEEPYPSPAGWCDDFLFRHTLFPASLLPHQQLESEAEFCNLKANEPANPYRSNGRRGDCRFGGAVTNFLQRNIRFIIRDA